MQLDIVSGMIAFFLFAVVLGGETNAVRICEKREIAISIARSLGVAERLCRSDERRAMQDVVIKLAPAIDE